MPTCFSVLKDDIQAHLITYLYNDEIILLKCTNKELNFLINNYGNKVLLKKTTFVDFNWVELKLLNYQCFMHSDIKARIVDDETHYSCLYMIQLDYSKSENAGDDDDDQSLTAEEELLTIGGDCSKPYGLKMDLVLYKETSTVCLPLPLPYEKDNICRPLFAFGNNNDYSRITKRLKQYCMRNNFCNDDIMELEEFINSGRFLQGANLIFPNKSFYQRGYIRECIIKVWRYVKDNLYFRQVVIHNIQNRVCNNWHGSTIAECSINKKNSLFSRAYETIYPYTDTFAHKHIIDINDFPYDMREANFEGNHICYKNQSNTLSMDLYHNYRVKWDAEQFESNTVHKMFQTNSYEVPQKTILLNLRDWPGSLQKNWQVISHIRNWNDVDFCHYYKVFLHCEDRIKNKAHVQLPVPVSQRRGTKVAFTAKRFGNNLVTITLSIVERFASCNKNIKRHFYNNAIPVSTYEIQYASYDIYYPRGCLGVGAILKDSLTKSIEVSELSWENNYASIAFHEFNQYVKGEKVLQRKVYIFLNGPNQSYNREVIEVNLNDCFDENTLKNNKAIYVNKHAGLIDIKTIDNGCMFISNEIDDKERMISHVPGYKLLQTRKADQVHDLGHICDKYLVISKIIGDGVYIEKKINIGNNIVYKVEYDGRRNNKHVVYAYLFTHNNVGSLFKNREKPHKKHSFMEIVV